MYSMKTAMKIIFTILGIVAIFLVDIWPTGLDRPNPDARIEDTALYQSRVTETRGKILAVVTSIDRMGSSGKRTGYELTELSLSP